MRYVNDRQKGISRHRNGEGFVYRNPNGAIVKNAEELRRIKTIAIPPAWTDVWICAHANGHIQATGRDARGRKPYRYHSRWRNIRDEAKYEHILSFGAAASGSTTLDEKIQRQALTLDSRRLGFIPFCMVPAEYELPMMTGY